jgi:hypothetical protein
VFLTKAFCRELNTNSTMSTGWHLSVDIKKALSIMIIINTYCCLIQRSHNLDSISTNCEALIFIVDLFFHFGGFLFSTYEHLALGIIGLKRYNKRICG